MQKRVTTKAFLAFVRNCPLIHTLDLRLCSAFDKMQDKLAKMVTHLPKLKNAFLSSVEWNVSYYSHSIFANSKLLIFFFLYKKDMPTYFGHLKDLEFLQIADNNVSVFCFKKVLSALPKLRKVAIAKDFYDILDKEQKDNIPPRRFAKIVAEEDMHNNILKVW